MVGLKREGAGTSLVPGLLLNTRLWRFAEQRHVQSIFFTVGVTAKNEADIDIDYLSGLSAGILGDRVIITLGIYYGNEERLAGDLFIGAKLPDTATSVAITKEYDLGGTFFVSYKIR